MYRIKNHFNHLNSKLGTIDIYNQGIHSPW